MPCLGAIFLGVIAPREVDGEEILFNRDIRPILSSSCFACHGPDSQSRKADLRLDLREAAIAAGAIVPGNAEESPLVQRIFTEDKDALMPPIDSHKELTPGQKKLLSDWVQAGAIYQPHWSLIPPTMPNLPEVRNKSWIRHPIDRFILARLESSGLDPAPEADIRTLVRRASYDVTGLPPTPEEVDEVLMDPSQDRYEKYIDRLLKKEQWGEHRGRYWLDYARFADTHGIHFDNFREMWAYRDWVIDAFNQNMPFDQFTIEQLAGDLLPNPTLDQRIATGFHRCNITTNEGGIIDEEYRVLYARDRTETTSAVWLGLTSNCAVCHDHKFDPITMKDFYSLSAFFNNTTQDARDGNRKDTPPILAVPRKEERQKYDQLSAALVATRAQLEQAKDRAKPRFEEWLSSGKAKSEFMLYDASLSRLPAPVVHFPLQSGESLELDMVQGNVLRKLPLERKSKSRPGHITSSAWVNPTEEPPRIPSVGDFERDQPFAVTFWVYRPKKNVNGSLIARMNDGKDFRGWDVWLEGDRIAMHLVHQWPENAVKSVAAQVLPSEQWVHFTVSYDGSSKGSGIQFFQNGTPIPAEVRNDNLKNSIKTEVPFRIGSREKQSATPGVALQDLRIYAANIGDAIWREDASRARASYLVTQSLDESKTKEKLELLEWYLQAKDEDYRHRREQLTSIESEHRAIEQRGTIAHVMQERSEPAKAYILFRGEYDKRRDEVAPDTPKILPPFPSVSPRNRLGLARWLLQPENPLTARVTVNRFWQEVFGVGLVASAGDFGVTGQLPSHPELLDYLACSFRDEKWNVKQLFRSILTSSTYRQSAVNTPQKLQMDPENRLLSRGPRFRLDAESVRDSALFWSRLLSPKIGGPSVRPYQPPGVWEAVAMPESNTRIYKQDSGDALYRRSMYTFWKRSAPPASMEILNAPNRETCTVRRERTNTPIQALVTLNDPQFIEAARVLAQQVLTEKDENQDDHSRLQRLACVILSRPLLPNELGIVQASLSDLKSFYADKQELAKQLLKVGAATFNDKLDPSLLAAWTMLANELMNLDEALNK